MSSAVEQIIRPFLSKTPSKTEIDAAEKAFEDAKRDNPGALVEQLFAALEATNAEVAAREQAAVLLRKCFEKAQIDDTSLWKRIGAGQSAVLEKLLQILQVETVGKVRRKVADCVQALGNQIINVEEGTRPNNIKEWPDLMPTLMRVIVDTSKDAATRGDCLYTVKELIYSIWQVMIANGGQTMQVLTMCFQDANEVVCGNALALLIELLENITSLQEREPFRVLCPEVSKVLQKTATSSDPKVLIVVLTLLAQQTEVTKFFKDILVGDLMPCLCQIAAKHQEEDARKLAIEAILQFFTSYPAGTVTVLALVQQALEVCTQFMMANIYDDLDEWIALDDDKEFDEEELFRIGRDSVDRICRAAQQAGVGPSGQEDRQHVDMVLEVLKPALSALFNTGQWKETVTGLTIFQQIAEYIDDQDTVMQLLTAVQAQLKASHPRVRHAAWTCLSQFSEDHAEILTAEPCVGSLMAEFIQGLDDPVERVCCRSMEAFQHFGESVEREDMESWVRPMMLKIAPKLKGSLQCQRKAITSVAVVAGQVEDGFAEYYGDLMPYLKAIISGTLHNVEERTLLGKCFECISLLAKAIGRKGFRQDAEAIMEAMIKATQVPNLPSNDPVKEYMMAASQRICAVMKEEFLHMVPHILPGILEKFTLAPKDFQAGEINKEDLNEDSEVTLTMTKTADGQLKFLFMSTSDMEDLLCALQAVHTFIEELGGSFAPFVPDTAKALVPVFDFNIDEEIRDLAFETWGNLCLCAQKANQASVVSDLVMEFLKHVVPAFDQEQHLDLDAMKTKAGGMTCILKKAGPNILQLEQVKSLVELTIKAMMQSFARREENLQEKAKAKAGGKDDDADEDLGMDEEEALRIALAETAGALMKHHPEAFVTCGLERYLNLVTTLTQSNDASDRKLILFIVCDFLEHLGPRAVAHWDKFLPVVLEDVLCPDALRRQPACYSISLAAREAAFAPVALDAAKKLSQVVTQSRGRAKKKSERSAQACADNALSGLIALLQNHKEALGATQEELWNVWLLGLPCQEDEEEGVRNHKNLLKFVMEERIEVLKQGAVNFPKVLAILVDQYKTPMCDEETNKGIQQLVLNLGQAKLEQFATSLTEKQKKKLLRVHREATAAPAS